MTVRYDIGIDDILAFQRDYFSTSRLFRRQVAWVRLLYVCLAMLMIIPIIGNIAAQASQGTNPGIDIIILIPLLMLSLAFFAKRYMMFFNLKNAKKMYLQPGNDIYFGQKEITLSEDGITITDTGTETKISWQYILKVNDTPEHFLVYTSALNAVIIPKRCLTGEQPSELRELFGRYVTPKK